MCQIQDFTYPSVQKGSTIHARVWLPQQAPKGIVQLVHGVGEHVGRYHQAACFWAQHGFLVCGEDHLGHGLTEGGPRGYFAPKDGWSLVVEDIHALRLRMGQQYPGVPYFLLGHSMGSFLTRTYLIRYPGDVDGAILSGTGQESAPLVALGKLLAGVERRRRGEHGVSPLVNSLSLGAYNRKFRPNRTGADWISSDPAMVDEYLADPLCQSPSTAAMFQDMMGGLQFIAKKENLARMDPNTPIFFFSGDQDPVGGMGKGVRKVYRMFQQAGCRDVRLRLYPGGRHEMLHETVGDQVQQDVLDWLEEQVHAS